MSYPSPAHEHWYVAARTPGRRPALLLGPYPNHSDAAPHVERARDLARQEFPLDMLATFADYGVGRLVTDNPPPARYGQ
jgi:hypothetical protein